jgi:ABC-type taurine transport system substrate-binding protein
VANDEGLVEGDGDEPAEVAADEGVVERDGVETAEVVADSDVAVPLFVQPSVSHWQLISPPSHWHVIPQRQRTQG